MPDRGITVYLLDGTAIAEPYARLLAFCTLEYAYYDALPAGDPQHIEPTDVLATVAVNSYVNTAAKVRGVHAGLAAACDPLLAAIPVDAHLLDFDADLRVLRELLDAAVQVRDVLVAVATKVLHRKRPHFIPMLDSVVLHHYLRESGNAHRRGDLEYGTRAASAALIAATAFREHLRRERRAILRLRESLAQSGFMLSEVRLLEILVWTEVETRSYYRTRPAV